MLTYTDSAVQGQGARHGWRLPDYERRRRCDPTLMPPCAPGQARRCHRRRCSCRRSANDSVSRGSAAGWLPRARSIWASSQLAAAIPPRSFSCLLPSSRLCCSAAASSRSPRAWAMSASWPNVMAAARVSPSRSQAGRVMSRRIRSGSSSSPRAKVAAARSSVPAIPPAPAQHLHLHGLPPADMAALIATQWSSDRAAIEEIEARQRGGQAIVGERDCPVAADAAHEAAPVGVDDAVVEEVERAALAECGAGLDEHGGRVAGNGVGGHAHAGRFGLDCGRRYVPPGNCCCCTAGGSADWSSSGRFPGRCRLLARLRRDVAGGPPSPDAERIGPQHGPPALVRAAIARPAAT